MKKLTKAEREKKELRLRKSIELMNKHNRGEVRLNSRQLRRERVLQANLNEELA